MPKIKIGLEIHGYLNMEVMKQKLFCECSVDDTNAEPNTNICPICTGQPGNKPMLPNKEAVDKAIAIGLMLGCKINNKLLFQRKHYSWPDLPNGYQKTMSGSYATPVGEHGNFLDIGITEVHLEEDPARWDPVMGTVDYNRSGLPLIEIVTEPDFTSADQVREWLKRLMTTLSYIKAINPDAGIKADVNVSIEGHERVEVKNVNSFTSIVKAIEYEVKRQEEALKSGEKTTQQTRAWDDAAEKTIFMRSKEQAMDYMFIPEPDLPVIHITEEEIEKIKSLLPERPHEKIEKFIKLGIDKIDAEVLASELVLASLFEKVSKEVEPRLAAQWLRREFVRVVNYNNLELEKVPITEKHLIDLLKLVQNKKITEKVAQEIMNKLAKKPFDVNEYVKKENLEAVSDTKELEKICNEVIKDNPQAVNDYKKGEEKALNFLVGKVMAKTRGKATPKEVNDLMKKLL